MCVCLCLPCTLQKADKHNKMLGDLDLMQCAQKDAPTMRRLSVELSGSQHHKDIPNSTNNNSLRRLSTSSISSTRSSMSQEGVLSPTFSSSMPNSFYLDRVTNLLGRASSLPMDRAGQVLPTIPGSAQVAAAGMGAAPGQGSPTRLGLHMHNSAPAEAAGGSTRASALIRSLSKGMDSFR